MIMPSETTLELYDSSELIRVAGESMDAVRLAIINCGDTVVRQLADCTGVPELSTVRRDLRCLQTLCSQFQQTCASAAINLQRLSAALESPDPMS